MKTFAVVFVVIALCFVAVKSYDPLKRQNDQCTAEGTVVTTLVGTEAFLETLTLDQGTCLDNYETIVRNDSTNSDIRSVAADGYDFCTDGCASCLFRWQVDTCSNTEAARSLRISCGRDNTLMQRCFILIAAAEDVINNVRSACNRTALAIAGNCSNDCLQAFEELRIALGCCFSDFLRPRRGAMRALEVCNGTLGTGCKDNPIPEIPKCNLPEGSGVALTSTVSLLLTSIVLTLLAV